MNQQKQQSTDLINQKIKKKVYNEEKKQITRQIKLDSGPINKNEQQTETDLNKNQKQEIIVSDHVNKLIVQLDNKSKDSLYLKLLVQLINQNRYSTNQQLNTYLDNLIVKYSNKYVEMTQKTSESVVYNQLKSEIGIDLRNITVFLKYSIPYPPATLVQSQKEITDIQNKAANQIITIKRHNMAIHKLEKDIDNMGQGILNLSWLIRKSEQQNEQLTAEQIRITDLLVNLGIEVNNKEIETKALLDTIKKLTNRKNKIKQQISQQQTKMKEYAQNQIHIEQQIQNKKTIDIEQNTKLNQASVDKSKYDDDIKQLKLELSKLRSQLLLNTAQYNTEQENQTSKQTELSKLAMEIENNKVQIEQIDSEKTQYEEERDRLNLLLSQESKQLQDSYKKIDEQQQLINKLKQDILSEKQIMNEKKGEHIKKQKQLVLEQENNRISFDDEMKKIAKNQIINSATQKNLDQDILQLTQQLVSQQASLKLKQQQIEDVKAQHISAEQQSKQKQELDDATDALNKLTILIAELQLSKNGMLSQIDIDKTALSELTDSLTDINVQIQEQTKQKQDQTNELAEINANALKLKNQIDNIQTDINDIKKKLSIQQATIIEQTDNLKIKEKEEQQNLLTLKQLNQSIRQLNKEMSDSNNTQNEKNIMLRDNNLMLKALTEQSAELQQKITAIELTIHDQNGEINQKQLEELKLKEVLKDAYQKQTDLLKLRYTNTDDIKQELDKKQQQYSDLVLSNKKLEDDLKALNTRADRLQKEIDNQVQLNTQTEAELNDVNQQIKQVQTTINSIDSTIKTLLEKENELNKSIQNHIANNLADKLQNSPQYHMNIMSQLKTRLQELSNLDKEDSKVLKDRKIDEFPIYTQNGVKYINKTEIKYFIDEQKKIKAMFGTESPQTIKIAQHQLKKSEFGYLLASLVHINYQILSKELMQMNIKIAEVLEIIMKGGGEVFGYEQSLPIEDKNLISAFDDEKMPTSLIEINNDKSKEIGTNYIQLAGIDKAPVISEMITLIQTGGKKGDDLRDQLTKVLDLQQGALIANLNKRNGEEWFKNILLIKLQSMDLNKHELIIKTIKNQIHNMMSIKDSAEFEREFETTFSVNNLTTKKTKLNILLNLIGLGKINITQIPEFLKRANNMRNLNGVVNKKYIDDQHNKIIQKVNTSDELGNFLSSMMSSFVQPITQSMNNFNRVADQFKQQNDLQQNKTLVKNNNLQLQQQLQDNHRYKQRQHVNNPQFYEANAAPPIHMTNKHQFKKISGNMIDAYCRVVINTMNMNHGFDLYNIYQ